MILSKDGYVYPNLDDCLVTLVLKVFILRLGAQSVTLLSTLRDPTQFRQRQWATRQ